MTGCYRRNIFDFHYKNKSNKSLILLDIDHFKRINDQYGHDEGDKVIKYLAKNLNQLNSNSTRVFRWGGEEFLIVLPKLSKKALLNKAESIRNNLDYTLQDGSRVTISLGVTEQKREESIFQAIYRADIALYQSKFQGRNKSMYL
ncbi:GGDEF domain-containing protein [Photobacterium leiognathi subsp. mandapamensis]